MSTLSTRYLVYPLVIFAFCWTIQKAPHLETGTATKKSMQTVEEQPQQQHRDNGVIVDSGSTIKLQAQEEAEEGGQAEQKSR